MNVGSRLDDQTPAILDPEEAVAWREAREQGSASARERLFERHAPLARRIAARRFRERQAVGIEFQDLLQLAYAGLLEAIDRFDLSRGAPFRAYAVRRIEGSVIDGLARMTEVRQQIAYRNRARAERVRALTPANPQALDSAAALDALTDLAVGLALGFMLDAAGLTAAEDAPDTQPNPYDSLIWSETVARLRDAVAILPPNEQTVIRDHYLHERDFSEIAEALAVSRGRVSQLHRAGLARLRTVLAPPDP